MSRFSHQPTKLDKVWDQRRVARGLQANGYILRVSRDDVVVRFHDDGEFSMKSQVTYSKDELMGKYENVMFGYMIWEEV